MGICQNRSPAECGLISKVEWVSRTCVASAHASEALGNRGGGRGWLVVLLFRHRHCTSNG